MNVSPSKDAVSSSLESSSPSADASVLQGAPSMFLAPISMPAPGRASHSLFFYRADEAA
jgi:hypothetical protein